MRRGLAFSRAERTATIESFLIGLDLRPPRKNLRLRAAHRTAAAASFLAQLDPRPVWKSLRLRVGQPRPCFLAVDPADRSCALRESDRSPRRLDPRPALNKPRLLAASIAVVVVAAGGLAWLTGPGPERTTVDPVAPGQVEPPQEATPAAPAPMPPPPDEARAKEDRPSAFLDCDQCPELIAIPAGRFQMGAPETDADAEPEEKPRREVAIDKAFALGRYEVSEREWAACANDAACRNVRPASATVLADSPKTHVTWQDTQDFLRWLNGKTGQSYRLPSEAEWEYAARAGADSRYPWGDEIGVNNANCRDCGAPMGGLTSSPVGSFRAERLRLVRYDRQRLGVDGGLRRNPESDQQGRIVRPAHCARRLMGQLGGGGARHPAPVGARRHPRGQRRLPRRSRPAVARMAPSEIRGNGAPENTRSVMTRISLPMWIMFTSILSSTALCGMSASGRIPPSRPASGAVSIQRLGSGQRHTPFRPNTSVNDAFGGSRCALHPPYHG